ncbi:MAG: hypothetical protein AB8H79_20895 [Myxococcota bacterium]
MLAMLSSSWAQVGPESRVTIDGTLYRALVDEPADPVDPRQTMVVQDRDVRLRWDGDVLRLRVVWTVRAKDKAWLHKGLAGPGVRVDRVTIGGRPANRSVEGGWTFVTAPLNGSTQIVLEGAVEGDPAQGQLTVDLASAVFGTASVRAPDGLEGTLAAEGAVDLGGVFATAASRLRIGIGPPQRKARDRRTLAAASTGMGLTVEDGAVRGRAQVRWSLRQGELKSVQMRVAGTGADVQVTGSNVGKVQRQGDRITVTLREPERAAVDLGLSWSVPVSGGELSQLPVPVIEPLGAFRTEASLQLARDGEIEALPELPGWQPIAAEALPEWGDDLVQGTPTAAYTAPNASRGGTLGLLRYVPVSAPPVMVDVASLTIAASQQGRTLTRANYTVRNERASHLRIRPPADTIIVGARVADGPVTPVADGEAWLIPLPRSLETVDGLLSFPVEVVLIGDGQDWVRVESRDLAVPVVDAPIAVHRVTLHLPPVFQSTLEPGASGTVDAFTEGEGIAYGFGLGGEDEAQADQLWQDAQAAYMRNDFDEADQLLDNLEGIGASNENLGKLRGNLDVVQGRAKNKLKAASARRVKEQAKSRGFDDYNQQEDLWRQAEKDLAAGNYAEAENAYKQVAKIASKLDKLEQDESFEQKARGAAALQNSSSASSGMRWQQSAERSIVASGDTETPDEDGFFGEVVVDVQDGLSDQKSAQELLRLQTLSSGSGWLGQVADGKDLGDGTVLSFANERFELDKELSFAPEEGEASEILVMGEEAEQDARDLSAVGGVEGGVEGGVVGGVVGGVLGGASGSVSGYGGLGARGSGRGGGGSAADTATVTGQASGRSARRARRSVARAELQAAPVVVQDRVSMSRAAGKSVGRRGKADRRSRDRGASKKYEESTAAPPRPPAEPMPEPMLDLADDDAVYEFDDIDLDGELAEAAGAKGLDATAKPSGYAREALEVTSTRLSVVVPVLGETLRFQHLLLPAGQSHSVHIEARADHTIPRRLP